MSAATSRHLAACRRVRRADPGDRQPACRAGQVLVRLDRAISGPRSTTPGRRRRARRRHSPVCARNCLAASTIRQAEADLAAKTAQPASLAQDAIRYRALAPTPAGSRQNAERTLAAGQRRRPARSRRRPRWRRRGSSSRVLEAEIAEARAAVAQAEADLQTARLNLGYTEIRSPIDGYVGNRAAQVGAYVAGGAYLLASSRRTGCGSTPTSRKTSSPACGRASRRRWSPTCCRARCSTAMCEPGARHRRGLQRHPAGERHRQFHQDRAARAGAHRARRWRRDARRAAAGPVDDGAASTRGRRRTRGE